jgi:ubiquinone/menaquinone biosynthesis C-methylase UbiE
MTQPPPFDDKEMWEKYGQTDDYIGRIDTVQQMIPEDVSSILDVGCGRGDVINELQSSCDGLHVLGMDLSPEALEHVKPPSVLAYLPDAPFADKSFDLVICLEVLEHINDSDYQRSLEELQRLAGRYVMISVPFDENLLSKQAICVDCKKASHADDHLRRFDDRMASNLLTQFVLEQKTLIGVMQRREPVTASWLRHHVAGVYYKPDYFHCPYCGCLTGTELKFSSPLPVRKLASLLVRMLRRMKPLKPYWWLGLYRRQDA